MSEYDSTVIAGLEWIWGEGFLSPGGEAEVAVIVEGLDLAGKRVLDIGCGLGRTDVLLVERFGASHVTGIDVDAGLVDRATARIEGTSLASPSGEGGRVEFRHVAPGPLAFADASFDVVFSKDAIIHIADKPALYAEVLRVLVPGGCFIGSDWLGGPLGRDSKALCEWLDIVGLTFAMETAATTEAALSAAGFKEVRMRDRNDWYIGEVREEIAAASGERGQRLAEQVGDVAAAQRLASCTAKLAVVEAGELRPTHFRAFKPGSEA